MSELDLQQQAASALLAHDSRSSGPPSPAPVIPLLPRAEAFGSGQAVPEFLRRPHERAGADARPRPDDGRVVQVDFRARGRRRVGDAADGRSKGSLILFPTRPADGRRSACPCSDPGAQGDCDFVMPCE
jgi:hypothetical protein